MPRYANETADKNRWNAQHYDHILIVVKKAPDGTLSEKKRLKLLAEAAGKSVSRYVIDAVNAYAGEAVLSPLDNDSKKKKD